jgi:hypothetical protein
MLPRFEVVFMLAVLVEFFLIPFTMCFEIDQILLETINLEYVIDVIWIVNMYTCFVMAKETDFGLEMGWKKIAIGYISNDFFFDLFSTITMGLIVIFPNTYALRILRVKRLSTMRNNFKIFWYRFGMKFNFTKQ